MFLYHYPAYDRGGQLFRAFEQAVSYYKFTLVNYIGLDDRGVLLVGGGDTNGKPGFDKAERPSAAYQFGKEMYKE